MQRKSFIMAKQSSGIWLHPKKNAIRVYMNTFKNVGEFADIENIPLNKWFHLSVAVRQRNIDLFINGNIVKRHQLKGIPKQNYGNVYVNAWRGFSGYLSRAKYYDYYLSFAELDSLVKAGPSTKYLNQHPKRMLLPIFHTIGGQTPNN